MPAGKPAVGRSGQARAGARSRRARQLDLVPHPGRLSVLDRQPALGLVVSHATGGRPQRPQPQLSARQGDRRILVDQRHALHARAGARLRSLAPAGAHGLGMGRRAALVQAARGPLPGAERGARDGRRMPGRAPARALGPARHVPPGRGGSRHQADRRFQYRRQRGLGALSRHPGAAAGAGRRRADFSSRLCGAPTCGWRPAAWSRRSSSTASGRSACAGGRTAWSGARAVAAR